VSGGLAEVPGQVRPQRDPKGGSGPIRPEREIPGVKVVTQTVYKQVPVKPTKVNLSVAAIPGAQITLIQLQTLRKGSKSSPAEKVLTQKTIEDEDGTLNLVDLPPGRYKVAIEHEDYQPHSETISVEPGERRTINAAFKLTLNYGSIVITGAPPDATVLLDGQAPHKEVDPQGRITIPRVPLGEHVLKVSKQGHGEREKKLEIKPGVPEVVPVDLARLLITLTVRARPQARVFINGNFEGIVPSEGALNIPNLEPGNHKILVSLDGFEDWNKPLALTLSNPKPVHNADLLPIAEGEAITLDPATVKSSWFPHPAQWVFERNGNFSVKHDAVVLLKSADKQDRFNYYSDFTLTLDLVLQPPQGGKGAAWIIRAKDHQNYYLFELTTSHSASGRKALNFYLCRDGKLTLKKSMPVVENIEIPGDSLMLTVEAKGNQFTCTLNSAQAPLPAPAVIGVFTDNTFSIGGVGFQGINGIEMLVRSLLLLPHPRTR
jgi:hypothetical protein